MNVKISVIAICVKVIIYLFKYNLYDCTFKVKGTVNYVNKENIRLKNL